jgi:hypothetical protein
MEGIYDQTGGNGPGVTLSEPGFKYDFDVSKICFSMNDTRLGNPLVIPGGVSIVVSGDALAILQELATAQGITPTEALRKALATEKYLHQKKTEGHTLLLLGPDKEVREVLFR